MTTVRIAAALLVAAVAARPLVAQAGSVPVDPYEKVYTGPTRDEVPAEVARLKPGMRVQLLIPAAPRYRNDGTLRSASPDSLLFEASGGQLVSIPVDSLDGILVSRGRSRLVSGGRGAIVGAVAGGLLLPLAGLGRQLDDGLSLKHLLRPEAFLVGAAAGGVFGLVSGVERWRRVARASDADLAASVGRTSPREAPRGITIAPFGGAMGSHDFNATVTYNAGGHQNASTAEHRIKSAPLAGVEVDVPVAGDVGVVGAVAYTLGSDEPTDATPVVTSGPRVLVARLGASLRVPLPFPASLHAGPMLIRETPPARQEWFTKPEIHPGVNLGAVLLAPLAGRTFLRLGVDDNVVMWKRATIQERLSFGAPDDANLEVQELPPTHLVNVTAGLAFRL